MDQVWRIGVAVTAALLLTACNSSSEQSREPTRPEPGHSIRVRTGQPSVSGPHVAGSCRVTQYWSSAEAADLPRGLGTRDLLGPGPIYPGAYTALRLWRRRTVFHMVRPRHPAMSMPRGWLVQKVLWKISRDYHGPVVIRGHEVGGAAVMKFSSDDGFARTLRFRAHGAWPSDVFVPHAGCYYWDISGLGFDRVLVFRATCLDDGPGLRPCTGKL